MEVLQNEPTMRPFKCDWKDCSKSFNRKSDLERHTRIHRNDRPFACVFAGCGKRFIQRSALTVHERTHTGEKPHRCLVADCGKRFSDSSSLARHRRIHTGKRPYKCSDEGCTKSFCRKTTMVKHQRRSHQGGGGGGDDMEDGETSDSNGERTPSTPALTPAGWPQDLYTQSHATIPSLAQANRPEAVEHRQYCEKFLASDDGHPRKIARTPLAAQYANHQLSSQQHQSTQPSSLPSIPAWQHSAYMMEQSQQFGSVSQEDSSEQHNYAATRTMSERQHQYGTTHQLNQRFGSPASFSSASVPTPPSEQLYGLPPQNDHYTLPHMLPKVQPYVPHYEQQSAYTQTFIPPAPMRPNLQVVTNPIPVRSSDVPPMAQLYSQQMPPQIPQGQVYSQSAQHVQQQGMVYGPTSQSIPVHQQQIVMDPAYGHNGHGVQQPTSSVGGPYSANTAYFEPQQPRQETHYYAGPNDQYNGSHSATF